MGLLIRLRFTVVVLEPAEDVLEAVGGAVLEASEKMFGPAPLETPRGIATDANPGTPCPGAACNRGTITPNSTTASTAQTLSFSTVILESAVYATQDEDDGRFFRLMDWAVCQEHDPFPDTLRGDVFKAICSSRKSLVTHGCS
jgi:hypothetical protein